MHEINDGEPSDATERQHAAPRRRRFPFQWSLQTLLLLTVVVAVWVAYFRLRQQIPRLEQETDSMQDMARELIVDDEDQIAVVMLPQMWYDESRWDVFLPEGKYVMRLATRQIDDKGFPPAVGETPVSAGRHRVELMRSDEGSGLAITVLFDDQPVIEAEESADWDPGRGSTGGSGFGNCLQRPADEPLVLFRRRFTRRSNTGQYITPKGPTEGLMLWIEPREPAVLAIE